MPGRRRVDDSRCRPHTSATELLLNSMSSDEFHLNFMFLISLFRDFSAPLSPVLTLHNQKNTKIKKILRNIFTAPLSNT